MKIEKFESKNFEVLMKIWESSVLETHQFLKAEDFLYFKEVIPRDYMPYLDIYVLNDNGIRGFLSIDAKQIEMLFIEAGARGNGYGARLLKYAIEKLGIETLDVNEQNKQALGFYNKFGFKEIGRSGKDASGRDYPILHLSLKGNKE